MGGCCGSGTKIVVKYQDKEEIFDHIADIEILRLSIVERLKMTAFDIFVEGTLITSNDDLRPFLHKGTLIEIVIKKKEVEIIKPPVKERAEASKFQVKLPKRHSACLCEIVDKTEKPMISTVFLLKSYVLVHKQYVPKTASALSVKYMDKKEKLIALIEYDNFWLYKIENSEYPSIPEEFIIEPTRRARILASKEIPLVQDDEVKEKYQSEDYLNNNYLGFPVFSSKNFIGFISSVSESIAIIVPSTYIINKLIPSTFKEDKKPEVRPKLQYAPKVPLGSIKFVNSPINEPPVAEFEIKVKPQKTYQESEVEEQEQEIVLDMNLDIGQNSYDQFTYFFSAPNKLTAYNPRYNSPVVSSLIFQNSEGTTFTSTPNGLFIIVGNNAFKVTSDKKTLNNLQYEHFFHSTVWHKEKLYVIGGRNNLKVEILDEEENWITGPDMLATREKSACCSSGNDIYLVGGKEGEFYVDTVFKLSNVWEILAWKAPLKIEGMGMIYTEGNFILFGGKGKIMVNKKYSVFDSQGKETSKGELPITADFHGKSIGFCDGVFNIMIDENQVLEYNGRCFKLVLVA